MARKSSINFAAVKNRKGALMHNDRSGREPSYLLPVEYRGENEVDRSAADAERMIADLYQRAKINYKEKIGQKLQAKTYLWEAVVNLESRHDLSDVQRLATAIEEETGFTSVQIAVHRDEGRVEERNGKPYPVYNYHAHITFFTLDRETGEQRYRRQVTAKQKARGLQPMDRARLSRLQDLTARVLRMERGEKGSGAVRLDHKSYRETQRAKEKAAEAERARVKDLQEENKRLRAELQEMGAKRADYAILEQAVKELRQQVKQKDMTISDLQAEIEDLRRRLAAPQQQQQERGKIEIPSLLDSGGNARTKPKRGW